MTIKKKITVIRSKRERIPLSHEGWLQLHKKVTGQVPKILIHALSSKTSRSKSIRPQKPGQALLLREVSRAFSVTLSLSICAERQDKGVLKQCLRAWSYLLRCFADCRPHGINTVKRWSDEARRFALGIEPRAVKAHELRILELIPSLKTVKAAATMARLIRSMPAAPVSAKRKALENHKKILCGPMDRKETCPRWLESRVRRIIQRGITVANREKLKKDNFTPTLNLNAAIGCPRKTGGVYGWSLRKNIVVKDDPAKTSRNVRDRRTLTAGIFARNVDEKDRTNFAILDPVALQERGFKVRIATKSDPNTIIAAQLDQKRLLSILKQLPQVKILRGMDGNKVKTLCCMKRREVVCNMVALSADLSKASDYIPHAVAATILRVMIEEVNRLRGFPRLFADDEAIVDLLTGPMNYDGVHTVRGILMGLPTTWPILTLLNMSCAEQAAFEAKQWKDHRHYDVCGDDLAALWHEDTARLYTKKISEVGLVINRSKHWIKPLRKNARAGLVFVEETCLFDVMVCKLRKNDPNRKGPLTRLNKLQQAAAILLQYDVQPRHIQTPISSAILKSLRSDSSTPIWKGLQDCWTRIVALPKKAQSNSLHLLERLHHKTIDRVRNLGIPPFWPVELGGLGLYKPKPSAPNRHRIRAATILTLPPQERQRFVARIKHIWETCLPSSASARGEAKLRDIEEKTPLHNTGIPRDELMDILRPVVIALESLSGYDKQSARKPVNLAVIAKRIHFLLDHPTPRGVWKNAKPMGSEKAWQKAKESLSNPSYAREKLKSWLDLSLPTLTNLPLMFEDPMVLLIPGGNLEKK